MSHPSPAAGTVDGVPGDRGPRVRTGRALALALAVLILVALGAWTVLPRSRPPHGRITSTIVSGNISLTATQASIGCTAWSNGTQGGERYAAFAYELVNAGDSEVSISVIIADTNGGFTVVAQRPYTLAPREVVDGSISSEVPFLGSCPAVPLSLGISTQGSA